MINTEYGPIYDEYGERIDDDCSIDTFYWSDDHKYWIIVSDTNFLIDPYIIIMIKSLKYKNETKTVRIKLTKPEYVGNEKFTKEELNDIIHLFKKQISIRPYIYYDKYNKLINNIFNGNVWQYCIWNWNEFNVRDWCRNHKKSKRRRYFIPGRKSKYMPNYSKLPVKEDI